MKVCYVVNTAPKANFNKHVPGKKKTFQDLSNDRKLSYASLKGKAPKALRTPEEEAERKRQKQRNHVARKKQRKQTDVAAATT